MLYYGVIEDIWDLDYGEFRVPYSDHFCSASDNNLIQASMLYYGVVEDIWELDYGEFKVSVFKYQWVNGNTRIHLE